MDLKTIMGSVNTALTVAQTVSGMLADAGTPFAGAISTGVKIAQGVVAEVPEAKALYDQFQSGTIPTQAELDAYAADEDGAYAKLMADLNAA